LKNPEKRILSAKARKCGDAEYYRELLKTDFNREGHEEREERKGIKLYFSMNYGEVLKLTVEDAEILISTAKIAKGRERSSVFGEFSRLFAVKINF
jgi:hypothetical protein